MDRHLFSRQKKAKYRTLPALFSLPVVKALISAKLFSTSGRIGDICMHMIPDKNPYTTRLALQVAEIPFQMLHHLRASRSRATPETHRFGQAWRQYLLFWMPPPNTPVRDSIVMFYHGGGWRLGWPGLFPTMAEFFLQEGFPVVMPAYRLTPWANHRQMREDLNLALLKTLGLMKANGLSGKKIIAAGVSAGATLAAHLVFNRAALLETGLKQDIFSGFISIAGPVDLGKMPDFGAVRSYTGGKPGTADFYAANPANLLSPIETVPVLLIHSTTDALVPFAVANSFFQKYQGPKTLHVLEGKTHLGSMRFATDDKETAQVLSNWLKDK